MGAERSHSDLDWGCDSGAGPCLSDPQHTTRNRCHGPGGRTMIKWVGVRRNSVRFGILAGLLVCLLPQAGAQDQLASKWFRYGAGVDTAWEIATDSAAPLQVSIRRKGGEP